MKAPCGHSSNIGEKRSDQQAMGANRHGKLPTHPLSVDGYGHFLG